MVSVGRLTAVVLLDHGFEEEIALDMLIPCRSFSPGDRTHHQANEKKKVSKPAAGKKKRVFELDLHAGTLIGNTAGMQKHDIVLMQLDEALKAIQTARRNAYTHVVLIHGKGTGKLRGELHKRLRAMERIEFYDAEYRLYSSGATEVKFY